MNYKHPAYSLLYTLKDPATSRRGFPAFTTLLFCVAKKDTVVFEEAVRLVELFMEAAYDKGVADGKLQR